MKRLEYVCTTCGRPSGRKFVAKRHLANVHKGQGAITSVMDYMLGVVNGKYPWPSMPRNGNRANDNKASTVYSIKDFMDKMNQVAQFKRDWREVQALIVPSNKSHVGIPPAEAFVGKVCEICSKGVFMPLTSLYEFRSLKEAHLCEPKQPKTTEEMYLSSKHYDRCVKAFPSSFSDFVAKRWLKGEKYLYAIQISPADIDLISSNFLRTDGKLSELNKTHTVNNTQQPHYLLRAINGARNNSWITIDDNELHDFISGASATAIVIIIKNEEDNVSPGCYLVAVVPPYQIDNKHRQEEFNHLLKELGFADLLQYFSKTGSK